jgi:chemotaxis methyl-accepting protein methylase
MDREEPHPRSHLFTLRVWAEAMDGGRAEWRGKVQHVTSGETRYFRDWASLVAFLEEILPELGDEEESAQ